MLRVLFFLLFTCFCLSISVYAIDNFPNNLKRYSRENDWDKKGEMLIEICLESETMNYSSIKKEAHKLFTAGNNIGNKQLINSSSFVLAFILSKQGNPDLALKLLQENESFFERKSELKNLAYVKVTKGHSYYYKGLHKEAIEEYKAAAALWESLNNKLEMNLSNSFVATSLIQLGKLEQAKSIFKECINNLLPYKKNRTLSSYYSQLGEIYSAQNKKSQSIYYFNKGAEFAFRSSDPGTIARAQNYLAISSYYKGDIKASLNLFELSLQYRIKSNDVKLICESYYNIGSLYMDEKKYDLAEKNFRRSITEAKKNGLLQDQADALLEISNIYKQKNNFNKALSFLSEYVSLKEKIFNQLIMTGENEYEIVELLHQSKEKEGAFKRESVISEVLKKEKSKTKYILISGLFVFLGLIYFLNKINRN
jgi:tetratricopeptide (TPR) repeat protein